MDFVSTVADQKNSEVEAQAISNNQPAQQIYLERDKELKPIKTGYLSKRGDFNKSLKVRWCVLIGARLYYAKAPEAKYIAFIPLDQAVIRIAKDDSEKYCFEIVTKIRCFRLKAKTQSEMNDWIQVLSIQTSLQAENDLLDTAEELISIAQEKKSKEINFMF